MSPLLIYVVFDINHFSKKVSTFFYWQVLKAVRFWGVEVEEET
jgi:hypothetical protein